MKEYVVLGLLLSGKRLEGKDQHSLTLATGWHQPGEFLSCTAIFFKTMDPVTAAQLPAQLLAEMKTAKILFKV